MPEQNRPPRHLDLHTMSKAHVLGQLVKIRCGLCQITRYYTAGDVQSLCGDVGIREIEHKFRCERCGKKEYLNVDFKMPWGDEIGKLKVRRLVEIRMIRRPIWRDDVYGGK